MVKEDNMANATSDILLTVKEAADILRVKSKHIRKLVKTNQLKAINVGAGKQIRYRIRQADLDDFLKGAGGGTTGDTQK